MTTEPYMSLEPYAGIEPFVSVETYLNVEPYTRFQVEPVQKAKSTSPSKKRTMSKSHIPSLGVNSTLKIPSVTTHTSRVVEVGNAVQDDTVQEERRGVHLHGAAEQTGQDPYVSEEKKTINININISA